MSHKGGSPPVDSMSVVEELDNRFFAIKVKQ